MLNGKKRKFKYGDKKLPALVARVLNITCIGLSWPTLCRAVSQLNYIHSLNYVVMRLLRYSFSNSLEVLMQLETDRVSLGRGLRTDHLHSNSHSRCYANKKEKKKKKKEEKEKAIEVLVSRTSLFRGSISPNSTSIQHDLLWFSTSSPFFQTPGYD